MSDVDMNNNYVNTNSVDTPNDVNKDTNNTTPVQTVKVELGGDLIDQILQAKTEKLEDKIKIALQKGTELAKQQLYPEISRLKSKISELESLSNQAKDLNVKNELVESLQKQKEELEAKLKYVEDSLVKTTTDLEFLTKKVTQAELEAYRNRVIAENKGKIIESLVIGNSIEEINASLENAKKEYEKIEMELKSKYRLPEKPAEETSGNNQQKEIDVKRINPTNRNEILDWENKRKQILSELYSKFTQKM